MHCDTLHYMCPVDPEHDRVNNSSEKNINTLSQKCVSEKWNAVLYFESIPEPSLITTQLCYIQLDNTEDNDVCDSVLPQFFLAKPLQPILQLSPVIQTLIQTASEKQVDGTQRVVIRWRQLWRRDLLPILGDIRMENRMPQNGVDICQCFDEITWKGFFQLITSGANFLEIHSLERRSLVSILINRTPLMKKKTKHREHTDISPSYRFKCILFLSRMMAVGHELLTGCLSLWRHKDTVNSIGTAQSICAALTIADLLGHIWDATDKMLHFLGETIEFSEALFEFIDKGQIIVRRLSVFACPNDMTQMKNVSVLVYQELTALENLLNQIQHHLKYWRTEFPWARETNKSSIWDNSSIEYDHTEHRIQLMAIKCRKRLLDPPFNWDETLSSKVLMLARCLDCGVVAYAALAFLALEPPQFKYSHISNVFALLSRRMQLYYLELRVASSPIEIPFYTGSQIQRLSCSSSAGIETESECFPPLTDRRLKRDEKINERVHQCQRPTFPSELVSPTRAKSKDKFVTHFSAIKPSNYNNKEQCNHLNTQHAISDEPQIPPEKLLPIDYLESLQKTEPQVILFDPCHKQSPISYPSTVNSRHSIPLQSSVQNKITHSLKPSCDARMKAAAKKVQRRLSQLVEHQKTLNEQEANMYKSNIYMENKNPIIYSLPNKKSSDTMLKHCQQEKHHHQLAGIQKTPSSAKQLQFKLKQCIKGHKESHHDRPQEVEKYLPESKQDHQYVLDYTTGSNRQYSTTLPSVIKPPSLCSKLHTIQGEPVSLHMNRQTHNKEFLKKKCLTNSDIKTVPQHKQALHTMTAVKQHKPILPNRLSLKEHHLPKKISTKNNLTQTKSVIVELTPKDQLINIPYLNNNIEFNQINTTLPLKVLSSTSTSQITILEKSRLCHDMSSLSLMNKTSFDQNKLHHNPELQIHSGHLSETKPSDLTHSISTLKLNTIKDQKINTDDFPRLMQPLIQDNEDSTKISMPDIDQFLKGLGLEGCLKRKYPTQISSNTLNTPFSKDPPNTIQGPSIPDVSTQTEVLPTTEKNLTDTGVYTTTFETAFPTNDPSGETVKPNENYHIANDTKEIEQVQPIKIQSTVKVKCSQSKANKLHQESIKEPKKKRCIPLHKRQERKKEIHWMSDAERELRKTKVRQKKQEFQNKERERFMQRFIEHNKKLNEKTANGNDPDIIILKPQDSAFEKKDQLNNIVSTEQDYLELYNPAINNEKLLELNTILPTNINMYLIDEQTKTTTTPDSHESIYSLHPRDTTQSIVGDTSYNNLSDFNCFDNDLGHIDDKEKLDFPLQRCFKLEEINSLNETNSYFEDDSAMIPDHSTTNLTKLNEDDMFDLFIEQCSVL